GVPVRAKGSRAHRQGEPRRGGRGHRGEAPHQASGHQPRGRRSGQDGPSASGWSADCLAACAKDPACHLHSRDPPPHAAPHAVELWHLYMTTENSKVKMSLSSRSMAAASSTPLHLIRRLSPSATPRLRENT